MKERNESHKSFRINQSFKIVIFKSFINYFALYLTAKQHFLLIFGRVAIIHIKKATFYCFLLFINAMTSMVFRLYTVQFP